MTFPATSKYVMCSKITKTFPYVSNIYCLLDTIKRHIRAANESEFYLYYFQELKIAI